MAPTTSSRTSPELFRPSRPDFIETRLRVVGWQIYRTLFRPSRPDFIETIDSASRRAAKVMNCSGLLGRTSLRPGPALGDGSRRWAELFRPSRPDFIETNNSVFWLHSNS